MLSSVLCCQVAEHIQRSHTCHLGRHSAACVWCCPTEPRVQPKPPLRHSLRLESKRTARHRRHIHPPPNPKHPLYLQLVWRMHFRHCRHRWRLRRTTCFWVLTGGKPIGCSTGAKPAEMLQGSCFDNFDVHRHLGSTLVKMRCDL